MKLIGLDIGTTGCKACLFDSSGELLGKASREYPVDIPHPGWAEQDATRVWRLARETLAQVIHETGERQVAAIGLSVQGEAVMPVDSSGEPLHPVILGMDTRTAEQNAQLVDHYGEETIFEHTGMPIHTVNTLPKLLWLKQYQPQIWSQAKAFRLYEDFLTQKMTDNALISGCLASRTQVYDLAAGGWWAEALKLLELSPDRLSPIADSGVVAGEMAADLTRQLGLENRPLVTTGGHDQACGALSVGLTRPGLSMVSTGTAEVVEVALESAVVNETLRRGKISVYKHVVPGLYLSMMLNHSGGLLLRWFRDTFCELEKQTALHHEQDTYDLIFSTCSPDPTSLFVLPHFSGSGTPRFDIHSKGAILGLTFATTKTDVAKAILEGLTFELHENLEVLKNGGVRIDELRAIGGGARSRVWLQLKADITGIPVVAPRITEAAAWGAAMLAGYGAGCFSDLAAAAEQSLSFGQRFEPDRDRVQRYAKRYELYKELYPAVTPLHHRMEI